jgi:hypothetical protein
LAGNTADACEAAVRPPKQGGGEANEKAAQERADGREINNGYWSGPGEERK